MSNEIKVGDKVRVSYDEARKYQKAWRYILETCIFKVKNIENDTAFITNGREDIAISTKYLIKVEEEKKEAKIKLGDMVRVKGNLHEPFCLDADLHLEITNIPPHAVSQKEWKVIKVENRRDCAGHIYTLNNGDSFIHNIPEDCVELVEPTEQTEAEKNDSDVPFSIFRDDLLSNPQIVNLHNGMHYWQCYEANLAREIALKVANKFNDPKQAADYAVSVAKSVVEGLKRK